MSAPPAQPKIYHITHVDNLRSILTDGGLLSDAAMVARGGPAATIGMSSIKQRRLNLPVHCHRGDMVGDYVPFYFCPRSIMLFVIHCANLPELTYRGGQRPIVHLEADLHDVAAWAEANGRRWAYSLSNAGARYTTFHSKLAQLGEIDWMAVAATNFRDPVVNEGKQAEFLLHQFFPWSLVSRIGVYSRAFATQVTAMLAGATHQPRVEIQPAWYY